MAAPLSHEIILGVTHLSLGGQLVPLLKCPFCNFRNIHVYEIIHHIRYKDDSKHDVDLGKLDISTFFMKYNSQSRYKYESKKDLPLPSIRCLWCSYQDKVIRDLEYHFLDNHKIALYREIRVTHDERRRANAKDPFSFMYERIDLILEKAVKLARQRSGLKCLD